MRTATQIRSLLRGGDRRTVGHVAEVVEAALRKPELIATLVHCMLGEDEVTRMRAADALEKVSRQHGAELQLYLGTLLALFEENEQQELRWHLAVILPRLRLNRSERLRTSRVLQQCLNAKSSIVKTSALQGLFDLAAQDPALMPSVLDVLRTAERNGTSAMKARSRKLISLAEKRAENETKAS